jgi:hypothetical protein
MESEHDQLIKLQESAKTFREKLEKAVGNSYGEYRETRGQILEWFDEFFVPNGKMEAKE